MKKYHIGFLVLLGTLIFGASVLAQGDVDPNPRAEECVSINRNLRYRDRVAEVFTLQDFLQSQGYLNSEPTGFFGILTRQAVMDFQNANGITPASGYVGPITRAKIKSLTCNDVIPTPLVTVLSPNGGETYKIRQQVNVRWKTSNNIPKTTKNILISLAPSENTGFVDLFWTTNDGTENITIPDTILDGKYKIVVTVSGVVSNSDTGAIEDSSDNYFTINSSLDFPPGCNSNTGYSKTTGMPCSSTGPVISGVSGPQELKVNQTGTWTVKASDKNGGSLSYTVDWGDDSDVCPSWTTWCSVPQLTQQSGTFSHSYSKAGTYYPKFTVTSENTIRCVTTPCYGNEESVETSLSVKVVGLTLPPGCSSTQGYSNTNGLFCGRPIPVGCDSFQGYSNTTGMACFGPEAEKPVSNW